MLDRLQPKPGSRRPRKRVGRGIGAGHGKTAGRGTKGQGKRTAGRETPLWFEGGQMSLLRRLPKRGFRSLARIRNQIVNLRDLAHFEAGATVDPAALAERGLIRAAGAGPVKILGVGEVPARLKLVVHKISAAARRKLEQAGGSVEILA